MLFELYFVYGILFFVAIVLGMETERFIAARLFAHRSAAMRLFRRFERNHPVLCDRKDLFYSFFKRDAFRVK